MTTITPSLTFALSAAEAARVAAAERVAEDVVANQLKQAAQQATFAVGSTITARYQYKVGADGALVPTQTQITTTGPEDALQSNVGRRNRQALREGLDERRPSFADFAKPKPELSPTAETDIFAGVADEAAVAATTLRATLAALVNQTPASDRLVEANAEVSDETGAAVAATLLAPSGEPMRVRNEALLGNYAARAQFAVAGLYARNSDTVYSVQPITQLAA
jgi:hypothetical protein